MDEIAVLGRLDKDGSPAVVPATATLALVLDSVVRSNDGERNEMLFAKTEMSVFHPTKQSFLKTHNKVRNNLDVLAVRVGVYLDSVGLQVLVHLGLELGHFLLRERVGLGNDGNDVGNLAHPLEEFDVDVAEAGRKEVGSVRNRKSTKHGQNKLTLCRWAKQSTRGSGYGCRQPRGGQKSRARRCSKPRIAG